MGVALIALLVLLLLAVVGLTVVLLHLVRAGTLGVGGGVAPGKQGDPDGASTASTTDSTPAANAPVTDDTAGAPVIADTAVTTDADTAVAADGVARPTPDVPARLDGSPSPDARADAQAQAESVDPQAPEAGEERAAIVGAAQAEAPQVEPAQAETALVEVARNDLATLSAKLVDLRRQARDAEDDADRIRRRAEQDVAEQIARVDRDVAQIRRHAEEAAEAIRVRAAEDAELRASKARTEALEAIRVQREQLRAELEEDLRSQRAELRGWDSRVAQREQRLADQATAVEDRARRLETREEELAAREVELGGRGAELTGLETRLRQELERAAGLTSAEARTELVKVVEDQARLDAAVRVREIEARAEEEAEDRARRIVTLAIQRVASEQTAESVVSVLHLPSDEMKGRIIGREGRNIRAFESVTGVNVLIDDTPEAVLLSCFDPVRRETARITLAALVSDGRIHPHRIEEEYARAEREVMAKCVRAGEDALIDVGIAEMHPELITLLGRLRYRTSYGQNVLAHLVECAHLAGIMAAELRLPPAIAKRGTLLHDLGKALTHEVEGSHALVGAEIARRYGEHEDVVHAIEAHHNEVEPRSIGAVLTQAADQISGGRPGARRDSLESYVRRLERIEQIAGERPGVEKVFAMQAGREVRVMVVPEVVDDDAAHLLARDVAKQIESELTYPGQIRVTVVRETRAIGLAR
ncbi:ribonucrease Y [Parafrankia irregularis]|uniref:Ribonuclease Y n=1 Tax=Parafrankia irregularis TaxID=795642 RepID=A0A0S4QMD7_9ACTN|nr:MULTISPECIES: ribonuclease Y [Parafrankia]MBE3205494.1 ribonuclease Y [Parafrankia sp. CH37]CUU55610.1 ribonucrease Y [Parafrankia irregularis]